MLGIKIILNLLYILIIWLLSKGDLWNITQEMKFLEL